MAIQHKNIAEAELHETKGISTALVNQVQFASGAGSGSWGLVDSTRIKGLAGDGGSSNKRLVSDGVNGFTMKTDTVHGSMVITNNLTAFTVPAAADSTLKTTTDYVLLTGVGAPWASEQLFGDITFTTDRLTVPVAGIYKIDLWASVGTFPSSTAKLSVKYRVNGGAFSSRNPIVKSNAVGDADQLTGFGLISLSAGDYLQLYIASTVAGGVVFTDVNNLLTLVRAT